MPFMAGYNEITRNIKEVQIMDFSGKVAISTGAASGMGFVFAREFARLGGDVVLCDVNEPVLNEKVAEINAMPRCISSRMSSRAVRRISRIIATCGRLTMRICSRMG